MELAMNVAAISGLVTMMRECAGQILVEIEEETSIFIARIKFITANAVEPTLVRASTISVLWATGGPGR